MDSYRYAGSIGVAERTKIIPEDQLSIFEFGSGSGLGLGVLSLFAGSRAEGSTVMGSELHDADRERASLVAGRLISVENKVRTDGITALDSSRGEFDVVLAHMFGPDYRSSGLASEFIPVAQSALRDGGVVIIDSDLKTMRGVEAWTLNNIEPSKVTVLEPSCLPSGFIAMPHVLIAK